MSEASPRPKAEDGTPKAAKDKNCPYCGQAFTSSSLGRHLDLYIKERNPKKQDGIHNVEEIRRLRGSITRRHPKGSSRRRNTVTPAGTPSAVPRRADASADESSDAPSPAVGAAGARASVGTSAADIASMFPLGGVRWEATGVMNEVLAESLDGAAGASGAHGSGGAQPTSTLDTRGFNPNRRPVLSRAVSRHATKTQLDSKQKLQDALDDARAAELALREFTNAWRAAKQQIDLGSMPFDFDPLTMNFPALTLQCLRAQPTLFASTQLPTPASWSTSPPGASQFEALKGFFREEFRKWRVKCAVATTAQHEDLKYPPSPQFQYFDRRETVERAERSADALELEASKHLEMAFQAWDELPSERKNELWILELARGIATKQAEIDKLQEAQTSLRQEASSLKIQIEQLNRLQQPREFKLVPPSHIPMSERILFELQDAAVSQGSRGIGLNINDRHSDLSTIVTAAIGRWKNVIISSRASSSGMGAQRSLGTPTPAVSVTSPTSHETAPVTPSLQAPNQPRKSLQNPPQSRAREALPTARPPLPRPTSAPTGPAAKASSQATLKAVPDHAANQNNGGGSNRGKSNGDQDESASNDENDEEGDDEGDDDDDGDNDNDNNDDNGEDDEKDEGGELGEEVDGEDDVEEDGDDKSDEEGKGGEDSFDTSASTRSVAPAATVSVSVTAMPLGISEKSDEGGGTSDKDADAEMEDGDEFAHMHTPISSAVPATGKGPQAKVLKTVGQPKISKSRAAVQQIPRTTGTSGFGLINAARSMPNISMPIHGHASDQHVATDVGISMDTIASDAMYMD